MLALTQIDYDTNTLILETCQTFGHCILRTLDEYEAASILCDKGILEYTSKPGVVRYKSLSVG